MKDLNEIEELVERQNSERQEVVEDVNEDVEENVEEDDQFIDDDGDETETETLVVDGEEVEEDVDELIEAGKRAKQKELAADERFQEAARLQRELEERASHLAKLEADLAEKQQKLSAVSSEGVSEKFAEALLEDESKAGEMFAQTLAKQRELEAKIAEMSGSLQQVNRLTEAQIRNQDAELSRHYHEKYGDIANNDGLHQMAMSEANAIRRMNQNLSEFDIMAQAAGRVRSWVKTITPDVDPVTAKKRNMQKQPAKAGGRTRGKPAVKPETREQIVADLAAAKAFR